MLRCLPAVVIACALLALPGDALAAARWLGFNDNASITGDLSPTADAQALQQSGANSVRLTVDWRWVDAGPGRVNLAMYDPIYRALVRRRIRPVLVVMGAPRRAWPPWIFCLRGQPCHFPPDRTQDAQWARFVSAVVRRYPRAAAIEVWNEPNLRGFWASGPDPARYTELLRVTRDAVKRTHPRMPVLGASLAPILAEVRSSESYGLRPFLAEMYRAGARGLMDGLSIHAYPKGAPPRRIRETLEIALAVRDAAGDRVPLWLTEVGASTTGGYTPLQQALLLRAVLPPLIRHPEVAAVFVHTLKDPRRAWGEERGYGVIAPTGRRKPAFCAVARAFKGPATCPRKP